MSSDTPPASVSYDTTAARKLLAKDAATAMGLAQFTPTGPASNAVVDRLAAHIRNALPDATAQLAVLPNARRRDIVADTLEGARNLLKRNCPDPAARLTLHAKYAEQVLSVAEEWRAKKLTG
ncbi:hypothetical protein ACIBEA_42120 [Streptomyces sp. NPDC051555]|uniref:hypothetical protein n=1 Tax=Streptomyces sp. NPDC051555 TaxID=3365657 RepID=UPI0037B9B4D1